MWLPKGMNEKDVLLELERVINSLMKDIKPFGYYDGSDDIRQQAYVFGIEALNTEKFDNLRPLAGFLRTCIINRFISLSRDKYCRNEPPCNKCPFYDKEKRKSESSCLAFDDRLKCEKYKVYYNRNKVKRDLMNLKGEIPLYDDSVSRESRALTNVDNADLVGSITGKLTASSRETAAKILAGEKVKKNKLDKLRKEIVDAGI